LAEYKENGKVEQAQQSEYFKYTSGDLLYRLAGDDGWVNEVTKAWTTDQEPQRLPSKNGPSLG
jgi:hypothetical protein